MHLPEMDVIQRLPRDGNKSDRGGRFRIPLTGYDPRLSGFYAKISPQAHLTHITESSFDCDKVARPAHQFRAAYFIPATSPYCLAYRDPATIVRYGRRHLPQSPHISNKATTPPVHLKKIIARKFDQTSRYWFLNITLFLVWRRKSQHMQHMFSLSSRDKTILIERSSDKSPRQKFDIAEHIASIGNFPIRCIGVDIGPQQGSANTTLLKIYERGSVVSI